MDKLFGVAGVVFTHLLFLLVEVGFVVALYTGAVDKDKSLMVIAILLRIAKQCLIPIWKQDKKTLKEAFRDG